MRVIQLSFTKTKPQGEKDNEKRNTTIART